MIKINVECVTILSGWETCQVICPYCGDKLEFSSTASPYQCFHCFEDLPDYSGLKNSSFVRKSYHLNGKEAITLDTAEAFNFS